MQDRFHILVLDQMSPFNKRMALNVGQEKSTRFPTSIFQVMDIKIPDLMQN